MPQSDDSIFPWRDLYPLAGQRVLWNGSEWAVLSKHDHDNILKLVLCDTEPSNPPTVAIITRMECRPLGWSLLDELSIDLDKALNRTPTEDWDAKAYLDAQLAKPGDDNGEIF